MKFPSDLEIARAERHVYERRRALGWRGALLLARARRRIRSPAALVVAAVAGYVLASTQGRLLLAAASVLRWSAPLARLLRG